MSKMLKTILLSSTLLLSACATTYHPYQNTMGGAAAGAALGAVAGHQLHHDNGRYYGAAAGAVLGGLLGNQYDKRQNAYYQAPPRRQYSQSPYNSGQNPYNSSSYPTYSERSNYYK